MSWEPSQHLLIDTRKPRKRSSRSDHFTPGEEILCFPLNRLDGPPKRSVLRTCEDRISAVQYGSGAVSTKVYGNSEVVFDISRNGKLTLHVAGNVAAYKVSHPTPPHRHRPILNVAPPYCYTWPQRRVRSGRNSEQMDGP